MTWNSAHAICISLQGSAATTTFDQVLDEFFASVVKESVGEHLRWIRRERLDGIVCLVLYGRHEDLRRYCCLFVGFIPVISRQFILLNVWN